MTISVRSTPYGVCIILNADYEFDLGICVVQFFFSDSFSGVDMGPFSCTKSGGAELGGSKRTMRVASPLLLLFVL